MNAPDKDDVRRVLRVIRFFDKLYLDGTGPTPRDWSTHIGVEAEPLRRLAHWCGATDPLDTERVRP